MLTTTPRILLATAMRMHDQVVGIAQYASQANWHLDLKHYFSGEIHPTWKGEGIITMLGENDELTKFIQAMLPVMPIVCLSSNREGMNIPCVDFDSEEIGKIAALHFIERDFKNYAFYSHNDWPVSALRGTSYRKHIEQAGHSCQTIVWSRKKGRRKNTWDNRQKWLKQELAKLPKPLAMFAADDMHATEIIEACIDLNFKIPDTVAILGVGNFELFSNCRIVGLSSICVDIYQHGYEAARLLEGLIQGKKAPTQPILITPTGIKVRKSTDTIATEHPALNLAIRFMLDNYHESIAIEDIVKSSRISQSLLYQLFKNHFKQSPVHFLTAIRLKKAKELLRESNLKITAIAYKCGFGNPVNLFRVFQRFEGITPKKYRQTTPSQASQ